MSSKRFIIDYINNTIVETTKELSVTSEMFLTQEDAIIRFKEKLEDESRVLALQIDTLCDRHETILRILQGLV